MTAALTELSHTLWRQRRLLEVLLYRLELQQLVLTTGRTRWVEAATRDVETVTTELRAVELERAVRAATVAAELGLAGEPTLTRIAEAAQAPWGDIMAEHLDALRGLTAEIQTTGRHNHELLLRGFQASQEFLALAAGDAGDGYAAHGRRRSLRPPVHTFDRAG